MVAITRAVRAEIDNLIEQAEAGKIVLIVKKIMDFLEKNDLLYRLKIPPMLMIVHRNNRDGFGVGVQDVHELLDDIMDTGFEITETDPVGTEADQLDLDFNATLLEGAKGFLGSPESVNLARFASIANSHTSFATRVVSEETLHKGDQSLCKNGKLSMSVCETSAPELWKACKEGLEWRIIRKEVIDTWPRLALLIQSSKNTKNERGEHDLQMLRRVHNIVSSQVGKGERPDYEKVKRSALRSKPKNAASLQLAIVMSACVHVGNDLCNRYVIRQAMSLNTASIYIMQTKARYVQVRVQVLWWSDWAFVEQRRGIRESSCAMRNALAWHV